MDKLKVLVIDDKKIIGNLFEFTLGYKGHFIKWMDNTNAALDLIRHETFDIAFLDIVMPGRDGITILEEIKSIAPTLPVVMMSGYSVEEKRDRSKELGAVSCLKKPFEFEDVRKIIKSTLSRDI